MENEGPIIVYCFPELSHLVTPEHVEDVPTETNLHETVSDDMNAPTLHGRVPRVRDAIL